MQRLGAVVIGRNEARALPRCLSSVLGLAAPVVFVDSGSEDGSPSLARAMNVDVVELDPSTPFSVARARNTGLARALALDPDLAFIQFVDGDCEMVASWFTEGVAILRQYPDVAVVHGRVRERDPRRSIFARLYQTDFELNFRQPHLCGGIGMMRVAALQQVDGFVAEMVGFEDFELSKRMHQAGWRVVGLDVEMVVHEARMRRVVEWSARQMRSGYAHGQEATLYARSPEREHRREPASIWFWGCALPILVIVLVAAAGAQGLWLLTAYPALGVRIYWRLRRYGSERLDAALYALSCVLGKFPQAVGLTRFYAHLMGQRLGLRRRR